MPDETDYCLPPDELEGAEMAHIRKLNTGRYQARYRGPDGREHARNFARKVDAERFLTTAEGAKLAGEWVDPRKGRPFWLTGPRSGSTLCDRR